MASKPTRNTQMMICAQIGTPRRGAEIVDSVMTFSTLLPSLIRAERSVAQSKRGKGVRDYFLFFSSSSSLATYGSWAGCAPGFASSERDSVMDGFIHI